MVVCIFCVGSVIVDLAVTQLLHRLILVPVCRSFYVFPLVLGVFFSPLVRFLLLAHDETNDAKCCWPNCRMLSTLCAR